MNQVELFGKQIQVRSHYCQFFNHELEEIEPYVNIYIRSRGCNAKCKFCEYYDDASIFNFDKYTYILNEIKDKIKIKKFSFTGGEPTLNYEQFRKIILLTRKHFPKTTFVLNTNGLNLNKLEQDKEIYDEINSISLSRHHYNDDINDEIFGTKTISSVDIKRIQNNNKDKIFINLTCNLSKGYIDSKEEVYKYLEYANSINIQYVGLVSLMPINDYCKENLIDFDILDLTSDRFNLTKVWTYDDVCRCNNYVYIPEDLNNVIKVYYKYTYNPGTNPNLIFDGENLTSGFTEKVIL